MTLPTEVPARRSPWILDNGAYRAWKKREPCDFRAFEAALELAWTADFVVAPDIPTRGQESLELSLAWLPKLRGLRPYLVAQDGMSLADVASALPGFAGIFIGGTLKWKLRHGARLVALAHELGRQAHIGRCGTAPRIIWAHSIGADSIDSSLPLWSAKKLRIANRALDFAQRQLWFPMTLDDTRSSEDSDASLGQENKGRQVSSKHAEHGSREGDYATESHGTGALAERDRARPELQAEEEVTLPLFVLPPRDLGDGAGL